MLELLPSTNELWNPKRKTQHLDFGDGLTEAE